MEISISASDPESPGPRINRAELHYRIRRFLRMEERAVRECGITPQQYWLLQAVADYPHGSLPTVAALAGRLCILHNSAVELLDRAVTLGLIERRRSQGDRRQVLIQLTALARKRLEEIDLLLAQRGAEDLHSELSNVLK